MLLHEPEAAAMASIKDQVHPVPFTEGQIFIWWMLEEVLLTSPLMR